MILNLLLLIIIFYIVWVSRRQKIRLELSILMLKDALASQERDLKHNCAERVRHILAAKETDNTIVIDFGDP